jgi:hypothetical protein
MRNALPLLLLAPCLAACSSVPKPQYERGWVGGSFEDVTRQYVHDVRVRRSEKVIGMPEGVGGDAAALVVDPGTGSPLAKAGLAAGDLVLTADGAPIADETALYEHVESMAPGSKTTLAYWRAGETRTADVVVGRETYEEAGTFSITLPLPLWASLDLWPFDDGFNVLGLVAVWWDESRADLASPTYAYRRALKPDDPVTGPQQESWAVHVVPFRVSNGKRVLRQETLP